MQCLKTFFFLPFIICFNDPSFDFELTELLVEGCAGEAECGLLRRARPTGPQDEQGPG